MNLDLEYVSFRCNALSRTTLAPSRDKAPCGTSRVLGGDSPAIYPCDGREEFALESVVIDLRQDQGADCGEAELQLGRIIEMEAARCGPDYLHCLVL